MPDPDCPSRRVQLGVIGRAHGIRGLVKVTSHTAVPADLTAYGPLSDAAGGLYTLLWKADGIAEVTRLINGAAVKVTDRAEAEKLANIKLFVERSALPPADEGEYYLTDLLGLAVADTAGSSVGTVLTVHDYGAGASLEIDSAVGPVLVPFTRDCVPVVDIAAGQVVVSMPNEIIVADEERAA